MPVDKTGGGCNSQVRDDRGFHQVGAIEAGEKIDSGIVLEVKLICSPGFGG